MAAYQPGVELQEIPLCAGRFKHFVCIDAHPVEDDGELVHEGDVDVALGVLDDLGCFGNFYRRGAVNTCFNDHLVCLCNILG